MTNTTKTTCPLCGATAQNVSLGQAYDRVYRIPGTFELIKCGNCQVIFTWPQLPLEQAMGYYPATYYALGSAEYQVPLRARGAEFDRGILAALKSRSQLIRKHSNEGRLLDIGCGMGYFLYGMQLEGWDHLYGIEPSHLAAQYTRESLDVVVWEQPFPDISSLGDEKFDVITMSHVFEHLQDPVQALDAIRFLLSTEGVCIVIIPNADSLDCRWFGSAWAGYDVPRHYFSYPRSTFRSLANRCGFKVIDEAYVDSIHGMMMQNIRSVLVDRQRCKLWRPVDRTLACKPTQTVLNPLYSLLMCRGLMPSCAYVIKHDSPKG